MILPDTLAVAVHVKNIFHLPESHTTLITYYTVSKYLYCFRLIIHKSKGALLLLIVLKRGVPVPLYFF